MRSKRAIVFTTDQFKSELQYLFTMNTRSSAAALLLLIGVTNAIYPDDHWEYSNELTVDTFKPFVADEIEAGRTLFVRWIASEG